jgi:cobalt-zinc-cadmium efflux system membrane fusion protein
VSPAAVQATGLQVAPVVEREVAQTLVAIGRVKPRAGAEAEVAPPFAGTVVTQSILPKIGDLVRRGQHLAEIEQQFAASERLQVESTAVQLAASEEEAQQGAALKRTELDRAQQLYDGGAIALKQLQIAKVDLAQAEARLDGLRNAKKQYDAARSTVNGGPRRVALVAPIAGTVIASDVSIGQQVEPSNTLFTITDLDVVWVEASIHEQDLPRLQGIRDADIVIPGSSDPSFTGSLVTIGNAIDPQNRTTPAIFAVRNRGRVLKLDMFVEAHIALASRAPALVIPISAVLTDAGSSSVYVQSQPGVYRRQTITTGQRDGDTVVALSGLMKGQSVVSVGAQTLRGESMKSEIPVDEDDKPEAK